jgi:hypothetical protein
MMMQVSRASSKIWNMGVLVAHESDEEQIYVERCADNVIVPEAAITQTAVRYKYRREYDRLGNDDSGDLRAERN